MSDPFTLGSISPNTAQAAAPRHANVVRPAASVPPRAGTVAAVVPALASRPPGCSRRSRIGAGLVPSSSPSSPGGDATRRVPRHGPRRRVADEPSGGPPAPAPDAPVHRVHRSPDPPETALVERARHGDATAFGELVTIHQAAAFRVAYVLTASTAEAEDAAQEAFVKAYLALDRFRAGAPFRPWLLTIVGNEARNRLRARGRREGLADRALAAIRGGATRATTDGSPRPAAAADSPESRGARGRDAGRGPRRAPGPGRRRAAGRRLPLPPRPVRVRDVCRAGDSRRHRQVAAPSRRCAGCASRSRRRA